MTQHTVESLVEDAVEGRISMTELAINLRDKLPVSLVKQTVESARTLRRVRSS